MTTALRVANAVALARALAYDDLRTLGIEPHRVTLWEGSGPGPVLCGLKLDGRVACTILPLGPTPNDETWKIDVVWDL